MGEIRLEYSLARLVIHNAIVMVMPMVIVLIPALQPFLQADPCPT